jgi:hypothetical protein
MVTKKPRSSAGSMILRISLSESDPEIWRIVHVSQRMTLHQLHRVIQTLFLWADYHLYEFRIGDQSYQEPGEESEGLDAKRTSLGSLRTL